ncbi:hypothetical protein [Pleomorphomonas sp. PLEO]|uniref:hypothetical protein n=1 Tax=Pleomorphomonas sp. PLEO TaxID=3239306 RepID=UPI00351EE7BA
MGNRRGRIRRMGKPPMGEVTHVGDVVVAVWRVATDPSCPMRLPAGVDAVAASGLHVGRFMRDGAY